MKVSFQSRKSIKVTFVKPVPKPAPHGLSPGYNVYCDRNNHTYTLFKRHNGKAHFLTIWQGQVQVERHGEESQLVQALQPVDADLEHAAEVYRRSMMSKTPDAARILLEILGEEPPKYRTRRAPKKRVRVDVQATGEEGMTTVYDIAKALDVDPAKARRILRKSTLLPTDGRWQWKNKDDIQRAIQIVGTIDNDLR